MFDLSTIFAGAAFAADATSAAEPAGDVTASLMRFMPLALIFAVFYFLLIRPQQKKLEEHTAMVKALKKGDKVVTGGGIVGTVAKLDGEEYAVVEIADGVQMKVIRSTITGVVDDKKAAKPAAETKKK